MHSANTSGLSVDKMEQIRETLKNAAKQQPRKRPWIIIIYVLSDVRCTYSDFFVLYIVILAAI